MKILSLNVNGYKNIIWPQKNITQYIIAFFELGGDIAILHEFPYEYSNNKDNYYLFKKYFSTENYTLLEPETLNNKPRFITLVILKNGNFPDKSCIIQKRNVWARCIEAEIKLDTNEKINLLGVHVPDASSFKRIEDKAYFWIEILLFAEKCKNSKTIIIGDFNTFTKDDSQKMVESTLSECLKRLVDIGYIDAWCQKHTEEKVYTWYSSDNDGRRLDYAFISNSLLPNLKLPLISAKVIKRGQGIAGDGFYPLYNQLGIATKGKSEKELFHEELKKIRECKEWYKLADYLHLNLDLARPILSEDTNKRQDLHKIEGKNKERQCWVIPSKSETYDVLGAFQKYAEIDWRESANYQIGDVIYIYCGKPYQRIMFKTQVQKINIPYLNTIDDKEFWIDLHEYEEAQNRTYARLKLIKSVNTDKLSLSILLNRGLKIAPRGPLLAGSQLEEYITSVFENSMPIERKSYELPPLPEELVSDLDETFTEGARKQIVVNAYERNPLARYKCILLYGSKCCICGFDFGINYGPEFEGKIHVHHKKPIHLCDETYEVNPELDLVPVCPNCHMIIHSKQDGSYTIEEVREFINKAKGK